MGDNEMPSNKQVKLLELAKSFSQACSENGIKYSLACGTMLGCVREKGFIPWDDDFDIMMTIGDYNAFEKVSDIYKDRFRWVSYKTENQSPIVYARIYESRVDFDHLEDYPYIDIHIYVPASSNETKIKRDINHSDFLVKCFWIKQRKYHNILKRRKSFIGTMCKIPLCLFSVSWIAKKIYEYENKYDQTVYYMPLQGYYKMKEVIPIEWAKNDQYNEMQFEDCRFLVIKHFDEYLTQLYGNYLIPERYNH